jgi:signal transduction histidine kinase
MRPLLRSGFLPLVALCAGLVGLGVLEYRWTDELARAEQDRLRAGMEAASVRFGGDLSREMGRLLRAFRPATWSATEDPIRYARQVEEWKAEAADPGLLSSVLIARDEAGSWQLRRLDGDRFVDAEWASELQPIHDRLAGRDVTRRNPGISPLVPEVPALVVGLYPSWPLGPGPPAAERPPRRQREDAVLILVLDTSIFRSSLLPALAAHHFADLDADVAIVSGSRGDDVIWSSRPGFPGSGDRGDVVTALLAGPSLFGGPRRGGGPRLSPGFGGLPPGSPRRPPGSPEIPPGSLETPPGPPGIRREAREAWRLVVAHHAGSLSAAVAKTRARNLAIGLGVLALLGGSAAFLAVAGHRARALARQQVTFVAAVSHELRTPLAAIRSAGQNLADGVVSDPEQVRRYGAMVQREGERLTALVEQTLELSGMLGRGRSVRLEEVDPAHLVGEVLSEVRPREPVEVDVPAGLGPVVADGVALRSALRNLVDNALKHGEGQSVAVHARMAGMAGGARELQLVVEDGGPGVPTGETEHLFEPFYRGAAARAQGVPGSGLGLSLVRRVAEAHGGHVSVGAGPGGRGVAFTLHLPLASVETRG